MKENKRSIITFFDIFILSIAKQISSIIYRYPSLGAL